MFEEDENEEWRKIEEIEDTRPKRKVKMTEGALNISFKANGVYWIDGYDFEYLGKNGIHHCFKSVLGGWSRCYTDTQLIDKEVRY